ncbi:MAG: hypothetical protein ACE5HA_11815, partial [Anaerolineae bacterium]
LAVIVLAAAGLFLLRERIAARVGIRPPTGVPGLATLTLPDCFVSNVFAEGLAGPRFMTVDPNRAGNPTVCIERTPVVGSNWRLVPPISALAISRSKHPQMQRAY